MNEVFVLLSVFVTGILIGGFFFGGLWWTVQKGLASENAALWFFGSTLIRTGIALTGFYFISQSDWRRMLVCLGGFLLARVLVTRLTRTTTQGNHAT